MNNLSPCPNCGSRALLTRFFASDKARKKLSESKKWKPL